VEMVIPQQAQQVLAVQVHQVQFLAQQLIIQAEAAAEVILQRVEGQAEQAGVVQADLQMAATQLLTQVEVVAVMVGRDRAQVMAALVSLFFLTQDRKKVLVVLLHQAVATLFTHLHHPALI
jgi:hypothetical protein